MRALYVVHWTSFISGGSRDLFSRSLLRHLTYEASFNPSFLSGITLKLHVSPQVVLVASSFPLECHLFSIFWAYLGFSRLAPRGWLELRKQNPGEILSKFQESFHCRDCIPLRNNPLWGSVQ